MKIYPDGQCASGKAIDMTKRSSYEDLSTATMLYYIDYVTGNGFPSPREHIWVRPCGHLCRKRDVSNGCCLCVVGAGSVCAICSMRSQT